MGPARVTLPHLRWLCFSQHSTPDYDVPFSAIAYRNYDPSGARVAGKLDVDLKVSNVESGSTQPIIEPHPRGVGRKRRD